MQHAKQPTDTIDPKLMRQRARKLRNEATEAERVLWERLRQRQLLGYKFRRQHPIGRYIVDFVCIDKRLIIEVDGSQHFGQQGYDEKRTRWLESQGYQVLRFLNNEVLAETESVIESIIGHLEDED
jgi:very-short-patch-repair endonuclease